MQGSPEDQGSPEYQVFSSAKPVEPRTSVSRELGLWRPDASRIAAARQNHFELLTAEEKRTYRNWRRATLAFYAVFLCGIAAIAVAIGPADPSSAAGKGDLYSTLASAVQRSSHQPR
jgi:hypothetical protein